MILIELHVYDTSIFIVTWSRHNIALGILWPKLDQFWPFYMSNSPLFRIKSRPGIPGQICWPGFRVNLTRFASVAYWPGSGSRFDPIWVKFDPDVFRVFFYSKFDCSLLFVNGRNVLSLSTNVYEHNLCWFASLFSNVLILWAFSKKRYQKQRIIFKLYPRYF